MIEEMRKEWHGGEIWREKEREGGGGEDRRPPSPTHGASN